MSVCIRHALIGGASAAVILLSGIPVARAGPLGGAPAPVSGIDAMGPPVHRHVGPTKTEIMRRRRLHQARIARLAHQMEIMAAKAQAAQKARERQAAIDHLKVEAAHELAADAKSGHPFEHATINAKTGKITVTPATFGTSGPFSGYLPGGRTVTTGRLEDGMPLLKAAAIAHHEAVRIDIPPGGVSKIEISPASGPRWTAGSMISSYGPRYAGSDVASVFGTVHVDGFDISASVTRGLPGWTGNQAWGGSYLGTSVRIDRPTPEGIFHVSFSRAHYKMGGPIRPLDILGGVEAAEIGDKYPLFGGRMWVRGGLRWTADRETLGIVHWTTTQKDLSAYAGFTGSDTWNGIRFGGRFTVLHGLTGTDSVSPGSFNLLGDWNPHYTAVRGQFTAARAFGPVSLALSIGGQHGSAGTPQYDQAYVGGEGRGSSFFTGSFAAPSGYWWSAEIDKSKPARFSIRGLKFSAKPFFRVDGGTVFPVVGDSKSVASTALGVRFSLPKGFDGEVAWAHTLEQPAGSDRGNMIDFELVKRF